MNVQKALTDMQMHFKDLAFAKIYLNRESIKKIDKAIIDIAAHLKHSHIAFEDKCRLLFKVQTDEKVVKNWVTQFVEANCKTLGSFADQEQKLDVEL